VVILNNTGGTALRQMAAAITNILYDRPYDIPKKPLAEVLIRTITETGVDAAIQQYRDLKENSPDEYDFAEGVLNRIGYQLIGMGRIQDAIAIFQLNVEVFPDGYNTYDSLAEAYMLNGERTKAIQNYAKSLELNPENMNAIEKLQEFRNR
jgi:tetratricopeptide (TPR) repeat protein